MIKALSFLLSGENIIQYITEIQMNITQKSDFDTNILMFFF